MNALTVELDAATQLAAEAGRILLEHFGRRREVEWKGIGNPVTKADREASEYLIRGLQHRFPHDAVLSEEDPENSNRGGNPRVWIIDPMDGTKEFIDHCDEFSVMIGLAVGGAPVLGVVYQPANGKLYRAVAGSGATLIDHGQITSLRVSPESDPRCMTIALSRSHHSVSIDKLCQRLSIGGAIRSGSLGLKVGLICEGRAHLYLNTSNRASLWDTCAPAAILHEAGGLITDLHGVPLRYDTPEVRHLSGIIASTGTIHDRVVEAARHG